MIDAHTHILPNIDDGASSVEESKEMLKMAYAQGGRVCIATPHCVVHNNERIERFIKMRKKSYETLVKALEETKQPFPQIVLGAEVYFDNNICKYPDFEKLCIGDSKYMLVEIPSHISCREIADWLYELTLAGVKPIIAHIDRCSDWLEIVKSLSDIDVIYQINASKFLTIGGRRFIRKFLCHNKPIIVGSDMHNTKKRPCNIGIAYKCARKKFGEVSDYFFRVENGAE